MRAATAGPGGEARLVLTAQDLRAGNVVYWQGTGWTPRFAEALVTGDADAAERLRELAVAANGGDAVVEAFVFPLVDAPGALRPLDLRETWRAQGPSIAFGPDRTPGRSA